MKFIRSTGLRILTGSIALLLIGLLFTRFISSTVASSASDPVLKKRTEKINLALRRTAHHLLRLAGDSTSRIPAVVHADPQTFRISFNRAFNYDALPALLQQSLRLHKIEGAYDVAILDCTRGNLILGYNIRDLADAASIPCAGRSITAGCYTLQVTFESPALAPQQAINWPIPALTGLLACLLFVAWRRSVRVDETLPPSGSLAGHVLHFGRSSLDIGSQILTSGSVRHNLTYREMKLLRLLVNHPNQVLERNLILKLVWEDEGITVGRSVDVFISRLRKLLYSDPTIKIAAVHGIGYRLDISTD